MNKELIKEIISSNNRITVITGSNGSGKSRLIEKIKQEHPEFLVLDTDSHSYLDKNELQKFANNLKEKSKLNPIIIATLREEIIDIADKVIDLKG